MQVNYIRVVDPKGYPKLYKMAVDIVEWYKKKSSTDELNKKYPELKSMHAIKMLLGYIHVASIEGLHLEFKDPELYTILEKIKKN